MLPIPSAMFNYHNLITSYDIMKERSLSAVWPLKLYSRWLTKNSSCVVLYQLFVEVFTHAPVRKYARACHYKSTCSDSTSYRVYSKGDTSCYIHSRTMELLKVVVLVGAIVHLTMALSIEGEQYMCIQDQTLQVKVSWPYCFKSPQLQDAAKNLVWGSVVSTYTSNVFLS